MSTQGKLNLLLTNSIYFVFSSLKMQWRLIQTKLFYTIFHSVWKETSHKPSKVAAAKNFFSSVYVIGTACFSECFLLPNDNWKTLFFVQIHSYPEGFCKHHVVAFFETSVLKEVRIYVHYLHNNTKVNTKGPN